jgi:hypothetical protein
MISGRLFARDMRRLEHACAEALVAPTLELVLDITHVTEMDEVAAAHLRQMVRRGATLLQQ